MSKIFITFEAATSKELCAQICDYVHNHIHPNDRQLTPTAPAKEADKSVGAASSEVAAEKPAPKKVSKKAAAAPVEEEPAAEEVEDNPFDTDEDAEPEGEALTFDQVNGKLEAVGKSAKGGIPKVKEILKSVGLTKVKEIKEEHFAAIVAACNKVLG